MNKKDIKNYLKKIDELDIVTLYKLRNKINELISKNEYEYENNSINLLLNTSIDYLFNDLFDCVNNNYWYSFIEIAEIIYDKACDNILLSDFLKLVLDDKINNKMSHKKLYLLNECLEDFGLSFITDKKEFLKDNKFQIISDLELDNYIYFLNSDMKNFLNTDSYNILHAEVQNYYDKDDVKVYEVLLIEKKELEKMFEVGPKSIEKLERDLNNLNLSLCMMFNNKQLETIKEYDKEINKQIKKEIKKNKV